MHYTRTIPATRSRHGALRVEVGARVMARLYIHEVIDGRRVCHARPGDRGTILRVEDPRWPVVRFDGRGTVQVGQFEFSLM